jgi:hypothetical protein
MVIRTRRALYEIRYFHGGENLNCGMVTGVLEESAASIFMVDEGSSFLRNVGNRLKYYTVSQKACPKKDLTLYSQSISN